jgi:hypothetical protein
MSTLAFVVATLLASGWSGLFYAVSQRVLGARASAVFALSWFVIMVAPTYIVAVQVL